MIQDNKTKERNNLKKLLLLAQKPLRGRGKSTAGFTLIELLVAMIIAALVLTPLLGFMINILNTERREGAKANAAQELQSAADFIARDLQQAVYIYDADGLYGNTTKGFNKPIIDQIKADNIPNLSNATPALVFWKRKLLKNSTPRSSSNENVTYCENNPTDCDDAFVYSLVAYYLVIDDATNDLTNQWPGKARLERFEIQDGVRKRSDPTKYLDGSKYPDSGYVFQLSTLPGDNLVAQMNNWEKAAAAFSKPTQVLIDNIDATQINTPASFGIENCPTGFQQIPDYTKVDAKFKTYSFYACVASNDNRKTADAVQVFLRGNVAHRLNPNPFNSSDTEYKTDNATLFPKATVEVDATGGLGDN